MQRQFRDPPPRLLTEPGALGRLFAGCCESAFETELGLVDPPVVDYMADLLMRFLHSDALTQIRNPAGSILTGFLDLKQEAEARTGKARRELLRHIGDLTLFWTGVYPERLPKLLAPFDAGRTDGLLDLPSVGRRSYRLAADNETIAESRSLLARIADEYDVCRDGLLLARRSWENMGRSAA